MKHIYLVRHGETTYNKERLVQDHTPPLTPVGERQAVVLAERLQSISFENIVSSDYLRAKQTTTPIQQLSGIEPQYSELFREVRKPSTLCHQPRMSQAVQDFLTLQHTNFVADPTWHHSDEENFVDVSARTTQAISFLEKLAGDTVVVSHGHFIRYLVTYVLTRGTLTAAQWQQMSRTIVTTNTGITVLLFDETTKEWQLLTLNDHAHFAE